MSVSWLVGQNHRRSPQIYMECSGIAPPRMHDIVFVGDVHEGIAFGIRVDPETGVSERSMDLHRNFARAARFAIENAAKLFIVLGDLFDRTHIAPVFREMVRKDVIEPLGEAGIPVWIVAGNHDQPRAFARSTSLDDFRGYAHVRVFRSPERVEQLIGERRVGFLVLPYLHPEQIVEELRRLGESIPPEAGREMAYEYARAVWKEWIHKRAAEMQDVQLRVLLGHYYVEGSRVASTTMLETLPGEFSFTRDMIPPEVDLAVFGHIHLHQALGDRIVYTGAPERIDWGERLDPKGFVTLDVARGTWTFQELPARPMVKVDVAVAMGDDPTERILAALPPDPAEAMVRLEVTIPEELRSHVDERRVAEQLRTAFHYEVKWVAAQRERIVGQEFSLDPQRLFSEYIDRAYAGHPRKDAILAEGERILREVLR